MFDTETIPDIPALRHLQNANPELTDDEVIAAAQTDDRPVKPGLQCIVAVAGAWIAPNGTLRQLRALGDPGWSETELVRETFRIISEGHPQLVGWNTSGFDLPVLVYRAMVHQIAAPGFYQFGEPYHGYRKRFDEESHIDLMDILSFYGASPRLKLDEMATVLGIPGKLGIDGSQVWPLYQVGELEAIRTYCTSDVLTTALVYGRYALHRGWWDETQMTTFEESVAAWLDAQDGPTWTAFRTAWHPVVANVVGRKPWDA